MQHNLTVRHSHQSHLRFEGLLDKLLEAVVGDHGGGRQALLQRPHELRPAGLLQQAPLAVLHQRVGLIVVLPQQAPCAGRVRAEGWCAGHAWRTAQPSSPYTLHNTLGRIGHPGTGRSG